MNEEYKPPFTITEEITNLIIEIGELAGRITEQGNLSVNPKLRRINRIKTIYSSLAIEQNTMSLEASAFLRRPKISVKSKMLMKLMKSFRK